jgi:transcriptional regulator with XRE-family HTH domain
MTDEINEVIAHNIKSRRIKLGYSQTQVAQKMVNPVTQQMLRKYEGGKSRISVSTLCDLAQALECKPENLLASYEDEADRDTLKREGKLLKYFRAIPTADAQMNIIRMTKAAANIYDAEE